MRAFANQSETNRLVLSTGTPIPNEIKNAFTTLNLLYPDIYRTQGAFESTHVTFKRIYIPDPKRPGETRTIQVVDSYRHLDYLSQVLYWHAVYASKREVLNLAAPNIQIIECELKPKHRRLYNKVLNERLLEVKDEIIDARAAQKLRQVALQLISVPEQFADDFHTDDNSLYDTVEALLDSINLEKEKVTIFANYIRSVEALARRFAHLLPARVYGPYGPAKNAQEVERFHEQESCRLLIANPLSGGAGFKLGDVCTTVIFAEPVSTPGAFDQCLSRVMLMGQTEPVICYIVNVRHTISPLATEHMLNKVPGINAVMGVKKSLFDALLGKPVIYAEGPCLSEEEDLACLSEEEDLAGVLMKTIVMNPQAQQMMIAWTSAAEAEMAWADYRRKLEEQILEMHPGVLEPLENELKAGSALSVSADLGNLKLEVKRAIELEVKILDVHPDALESLETELKAGSALSISGFRVTTEKHDGNSSESGHRKPHQTAIIVVCPCPPQCISVISSR